MVYFIQRGAHIKIGHTSDVRHRLSALQIASVEPLSLLGAVDGGADVEAQMHSRFKEHYVSGEWFHAAPDLVEFAQSNAINLSQTLRGYSSEFPSTSTERVAFIADRVPSELAARVRTKLQVERISMRTLILRLLSDWTDG